MEDQTNTKTVKMYKCENCGEPIALEEYASVDIYHRALCPICKKLSKKKRRERAYQMWEQEQKNKQKQLQ